MRPTLFRLASDTEDNDEALGEPQAKLAGPSTFPHLSQALPSTRSCQESPPGGPFAQHQP